MKVISDGGMTSCNNKDTIDAIMLTKNIDYIDGIKLDVRMSKDYVIVLAEDNDLKKFSLCNKKIDEENYSFLRKVKFPSHIFKYYIPTLEEVLRKYNYDKIIVLEIDNSNNIPKLIDELYKIIVKYPYKYYYISNNENVLIKLKESHCNKIGEVIDNDSLIEIIYDNNLDLEINTFDNNVFLITEHPEKNKNTNVNSTK